MGNGGNREGEEERQFCLKEEEAVEAEGVRVLASGYGIVFGLGGGWKRLSQA